MKRTFKFILSRACVEYDACELAKAKSLSKDNFIAFLKNQGKNKKTIFLLETSDFDKACNFFKQIKTPRFEKLNEEIQKANIYQLTQYRYFGNELEHKTILYANYPGIGEVVV